MSKNKSSNIVKDDNDTSAKQLSEAISLAKTVIEVMDVKARAGCIVCRSAVLMRGHLKPN